MSEHTMRVSEWMQTKVLTVRPSMSLVELHRFLLSHHIGGAPVVDGGRLVGIVTRSDIIRQMAVDRSIAEQIADYERDPGTGRLPGDGEADENEWINETASEQGDVMQLNLPQSMRSHVAGRVQHEMEQERDIAGIGREAGM